MTYQYDAVIIGAGVVGCSIALALAKRGIKTLNVDKLPAAGYGSTSHSSAIVRPVYSHITSCALAHESRFYWQDWQAFLGVDDPRGFVKYTECGGLVLVKAGEEAEYEANLRAMDAVGVTYRTVDAAALEQMYPGISLDTYGPPKPIDDASFGEKTNGAISHGIVVDAAGYVSDPQLASHNLQTAAKAHGAKFLFNTQVASIQKRDGSITGITTDSGETIQAARIINAAGPHSGKINLLAGLGDQLPIKTRPMRHEVVYLSADVKHFEKGTRFLVDLDCGVYQKPDGQDIVIGSADPACDPEDIVDPDDYNNSFTEQWTLQAYRAAQRFPEIKIESQARGTVGIYDVSDDWIPIYDKTDLGGYYLAIGTSGNQFKNAPLIGEVMAEIIQRDTEDDHDKNPASLHLKHIDRSIDLAFFSRNRQVQSTSGVLA